MLEYTPNDQYIRNTCSLFMDLFTWSIMWLKVFRDRSRADQNKEENRDQGDFDHPGGARWVGWSLFYFIFLNLSFDGILKQLREFIQTGWVKKNKKGVGVLQTEMYCHHKKMVRKALKSQISNSV